MKNLNLILLLIFAFAVNIGFAQIGKGPLVVTSSNKDFRFPLPPKVVNIDINENATIIITNKCPELIIQQGGLTIKVNNTLLDNSKVSYTIGANSEIIIKITGLKNIKSGTKVNVTISFDNNTTNPITIIPYDNSIIKQYRTKEQTNEKSNTNKTKILKREIGENQEVYINPCDIVSFSIDYILKNKYIENQKKTKEQKQNN